MVELRGDDAQRGDVEVLPDGREGQDDPSRESGPEYQPEKPTAAGRHRPQTIRGTSQNGWYRGLGRHVSPDPTTGPAGPAAAGEEPGGLFAGRIPLHGRSVRQHAARGAIVNAAFQVAFMTLGLLKGVVVAAFLTPDEYGVWGILLISLATVTWLKTVGASDKFVQQSESDQERAFQQAFSFELALTLVFTAVFAALVPLLAVVYGEPRLVAPGLVLALAMPLGALQAPVWVFYRRMEFVKQRVLQSVDPIVGLVVTIALAATGSGYWSLVIGTVAGVAAGAVTVLAFASYRLALRFDRDAMRDYLSFSWPLVLAGASSLVVAQGSILLAEAELGLAGAGFVSFASAIAFYSTRVDGVLTATLYPAICAVKDRADLLFETFETSNRVALIWGMPFGLGLALFAPDFVEFVVGERWEPAVFLLQAFGLAMGIGHIGHNWDAFYRARAQTRPIAVWSAIGMLSFLVVAAPLLLVDGLDGFAVGMGVVALISLAVRLAYLNRLFSAFRVIRYSLRAIAPSVPAVAAVGLVRLAEGGERTAGVAAGELALYLAVTAAATLWLERRLLRELLSYLRGTPRPSPAV